MPAELYIVRHAIAAARGPEWPDDAKRPLTDRGIERFKEVVDGLVWLDVHVDAVLTSLTIRGTEFSNVAIKFTPGDTHKH